MRVIAIVNQKGGAGKTTTAVNLGACLCLLKSKVLIVDIDPQANASTHLGIRDQESSVCEFFADPDAKGVIHEYENKGGSNGKLDVIPSEINLASMESQLEDKMGRENVLKKRLENIKSDYDFILLDCPPSLGIFTINALAAAQEIIVPVQAEFLALDGLANLLNTISAVRDEINPDIVITGALLTMFDVRNNLCHRVKNQVAKMLGNRVFNTVIRKNIRLAEAPGEGLPINKYDPDCYGSSDYLNFAKEVLGNG